jgi:hypothetical protein
MRLPPAGELFALAKWLHMYMKSPPFRPDISPGPISELGVIAVGISAYAAESMIFPNVLITLKDKFSLNDPKWNADRAQRRPE